MLKDGTKGYINSGYLRVSSITVTPKPTPTLTPTPTASEGTASGKLTAVIVNCNSSVNMRSGPSTSYSLICHVQKGASVTVLGKSGGWYRLRLANGIEGYISGSYISVTKAKGIMQGTSSLNLRSGPDTSYSSLSVIGANEAVTVLDVAENGWYKVRRASGQEGWASNKYIKLQ